MSQIEYLVLLDCDKIKDYVFTTGRLKEIRGASAIIKELTEDPKMLGVLSPQPVVVEKRIINLIEKYKGESLYTAGGAAKIKFKNKEEAKRFIKEAEALCQKETITGSLTGILIESDFADFYNMVSLGEKMLRKEKDGKKRVDSMVGGGYLKFCQSCGLYPVSEEKDRMLLCPSCIRKREAANKIDKHLNKILVEGKLDSEPFLKTFITSTGDISKWRGVRLTKELSELGKISSPQGYVGFIHCDGNRMGEHLKELKTEKDYRYFSKTISRACVNAAAEALATAFPEPRDEGRIFPFEVVLMGGDDLILITAADKALEVTKDFCDKFQKQTGNYNVSMSAGVVLAHANQPILSMYQRAMELLRSAKAKTGGMKSTIDFLVVTSPTLNPLSEIQKEYFKKNNNIEVWLIDRPYDLKKIDLLLNSIKNMKKQNFPKTKLNAFYDVLFQERLQATFDALVLRNRIGEKHKRIFDDFCQKFDIWDKFPWKVEQHLMNPAITVWRTNIVDLVELYDFVQ